MTSPKQSNVAGISTCTQSGSFVEEVDGSSHYFYGRFHYFHRRSKNNSMDVVEASALTKISNPNPNPNPEPNPNLKKEASVEVQLPWNIPWKKFIFPLKLRRKLPRISIYFHGRFHLFHGSSGSFHSANFHLITKYQIVCQTERSRAARVFCYKQNLAFASTSEHPDGIPEGAKP